MAREEPFVLDVLTPLAFRARCSASYWDLIRAVKHPAIRNRLQDVERTLDEPAHVRRSVHDPNVLLFYRQFASRWLCVVLLHTEEVGYVITACPADKVKAGDTVWTE